MSITFYLNCSLLHSLPKCVSKIMNILLGSGQYVGLLCVIPVVINYKDIDLKYIHWSWRFMIMWTG